MLKIGLAIFPIFLMLVLSELLWRKKILRGEAARKLLHIVIGSYIAFWPFFISFTTIQLISLALLFFVISSHKFRIFHAIIDVKRMTYGDVLYAVGIGITALLTKNPWIFAITILHLSVCDGLAGLAGTRYGKSTNFYFAGQAKSMVGTLVFALSSYIILFLLVTPYLGVTIGPLLVLLPLAAALIESVGVFGTDNILVPLLMVLVLNTVV